MSRLKTAVGALALLGAMAAAQAQAQNQAQEQRDGVYGEWCHQGERLEIGETTLVTPAGNSPRAIIKPKIATYTIPKGERDANYPVAFRQVDEGKLERQLVDPLTAQLLPKPEIWLPCEPLAENGG